MRISIRRRTRSLPRGRIYILGARSSLALATFLSYYMHLLFENVLLVQSTSEGEIFEQMIRIDENDVVIGISFPRYSRKAVKAMNFARKRGAKVVAITDSTLSPLGRTCRLSAFGAQRYCLHCRFLLRAAQLNQCPDCHHCPEKVQ